MKKVLIISYYWPPSGGAGVQRWMKFAKYLPQFGYEPIVLTVEEDYASYSQIDKSLLEEVQQIKTMKTKSFEVYNLYSKMKSDNQIPYGGFSNESHPSLLQKLARFVRGNFFIPDPRKGWNKSAIAEAKKLIKKHQIEVVITTSPPHSTQLIGLKIKQMYPLIEWVCDLRDPWTDIYFYDKFYPTKVAKRVDSSIEKRIMLSCDKLVTVSNSLKELYGKRYGILDKLSVITNGFDQEDFPETLFNERKKSREILYTGTVTTDYPLDELLELAKRLPDIVFRFIGSFPSQFIDKVDKEGLTANFIFQKTISHNEVVKEMVGAGVLLLLIPKVKQNRGILTGKIFEYIGARVPILAIGPEGGDAGILIDEIEVGVYYSYGQLSEVTQENIENLFHHPNNGKYTNYSRKKLTERLVELIEAEK